MATSQARERLLAAAVEQAVRGGIIGQSLREIAAAIGTSHRMLITRWPPSQSPYRTLSIIGSPASTALATAINWAAAGSRKAPCQNPMSPGAT